jgi:hypothetical protein
LLECALLDLDFGLYVLKLLFCLGEFCRRCLTAPLESPLRNAPLPVLLHKLRRLTVKALDIRGEGGIVLPCLFLRLTGTGQQRIDVILLMGIRGFFARDVGAPGIPCTSPDDATDTGTNGGATPPANECAYPSSDGSPCPGSDQRAVRSGARGV